MLKKGFLIITIFILFCYFFEFSVYAEESFGTDILYDAVPDSAQEYLEESNIEPDGDGITNLSLGDVLKTIGDMIAENVKQPFSMFGALLAVIILTTLLGSLNVESCSASKTFSAVSGLTATIIISSYLSSAIDGIDTAVSSASDFMLTYIPVLAGVIAVGGHASTAAVFSSVMMISIEILAQITSKILFPLTSCLIGISAAGGLNTDLKIDKLGDGIKRIVVWGLGFIMTIFIGFLTLQTNITASADSIGLRAARFAVSTSIPFVGGAVSDALSTVKTSVELLKSGIGSFGIVTGAAVLMPVLINALCYRFFLFIAGVAGDIFGAEDAGRMIKCGENVLSIIISMIICLFLFITISTTLMLLICRR